MRRLGFGRSRYGPLGWRRVGRAVDLVVALGLLGLLAIVGAALQHRFAPPERLAGAARAIDGDSLRLNGAELRLEGLDAPEYRQTCTAPGGRPVECGRQARLALQELIAGGDLVCEVSRRDRYGRGLARCRRGGTDVNAELVRQGHAVAYGDYRAQEEEARAARRGLWALDFERPESWRRRQGP